MRSPEYARNAMCQAVSVMRFGVVAGNFCSFKEAASHVVSSLLHYSLPDYYYYFLLLCYVSVEMKDLHL